MLRCILLCLIYIQGWGNIFGQDSVSQTSSDQAMSMTEAGLARLPRVGEINLVDFGTTSRLEIGNCYVDTTRAMAVEILNSQASSLKIGSVKTSCGCTAAFPRNEGILPGGRSLLLLTVRPGKIGSFGSKLTLVTNLGDYAFTIQGISRSRVRLVENDPVIYNSQSKAFLVTLAVKDSSIDPSTLKFVVNGQEIAGTSNKESVREVQLELPAVMATDVGLTPVQVLAGSLSLDTLLLPLQIPGRLTLIRDELYTDGEGLKLMITGDVQSISLEKIDIEMNDVRYSMPCEAVVRGSTAIVSIDVTSVDFKNGQAATAYLGNEALQFKVYRR